MTLTYLKGRHIHCQSTDTKPNATELPPGWKLHELDTGRIFLWDGAQWIYLETSEEAQNKNAKQPRSSLINLYGDTFAQTSASAIYKFEDLTDEQGGTSLTNNGTIDLTRIETELPLRGYLVPNLNGTSQYFSKVAEAVTNVGANSFKAKGEFIRESGISTEEYLVSSGDVVTDSGKRWQLLLAANGNIQCTLHDGTTLAFKASVGYNFADGKVHSYVYDVNRTTNLVNVYVDGINVISDYSISVFSTNSLTSTEPIQWGASRNTGTANLFFAGRLSNFQLYKESLGSEDYDLIPLLSNPQLRESANSGAITITTNSSGRINNQVFGPTTQGNYTNFVINASEGFYDLQHLHATNTDRGIVRILVNGIEVSSNDHYSASLTYNVLDTIRRIFLPSGTSIVKIISDTKNASSFGYRWSLEGFIKFIKRDGKYNESDEATSGILFGDELVQRANTGLTMAVSTAEVYNSKGTTDTDTINSYFEGDIYLKKGLYKVTQTWASATNLATVDITAGGVKVFDDLNLSTTPANNEQETRFAFLEGGKTTVRIEAVGTDNTSYFIKFNNLRFELVSGKGNGDEVIISGFDADGQIVTGTSHLISIATTSRFNGFGSDSAGAINNEEVFRRYFSGGTYIFKKSGRTGSNQGIASYEIDGTAFHTEDQYSGFNVENVETFDIVTIARGFHDVGIASYSKNASSSTYFVVYSFMQFTKIATVLDAENDDDSDPVYGAKVLIGKHTARKSEATKTLNFSGITPDKYSKIIVEIQGQADATLELQSQLNGETGSIYSMNGYSSIATTLANIDENAGTEFKLATTAIITGAFEFKAKMEIRLPNIGNEIGVETMGEETTIGVEKRSGGILGSQQDLSSLTVKTSVSSWKALTSIIVYAEKIQ